MSTEITVDRPDINTVSIQIKSSEAYKNITMFISPDEADDLAQKILASRLGQIVGSD